MPVDVDYACEFRYRDAAPGARARWRWRSRSRARPPTRWRRCAWRASSARARRAICNVDRQHARAREPTPMILTQAGPEIGVASTKAFVAQVVAAYLLARAPRRARAGRSTRRAGARCSSELRRLRPRMEQLLGERAVDARARDRRAPPGRARASSSSGAASTTRSRSRARSSSRRSRYVHAEGYPAGEMKHGPIALIEPAMPIVVHRHAGPRGREGALEHRAGARARRARDLRRLGRARAWRSRDERVEVPRVSASGSRRCST